DPGLDRLTGLVNEELHPIEFEQKVVRELDIRLVDLIDEKHRAVIHIEAFPELSLLDVVLDVLHALVAELAVAQTRYRVVLVETLLRLRRRLDVPGDER